MVTHEGLKNGVGCVGGNLEDRDRGAGRWPLAKDKIFHKTKLHNDIYQLSFDGRCRNNSNFQNQSTVWHEKDKKSKFAKETFGSLGSKKSLKQTPLKIKF